MSVHHLQRGQVARPARRASQASRMAPPIKGIDIRAAASQNEPGTAIFLRNLVPTERGVEIRSGYREWQLNVEQSEGSSAGIRTLVPFESVTNLDADNRLFAITNEGIWDVTQPEAAPVLKLTFTITTGGAGYATYAQYASNSGEDQLSLADMENGLFSYDRETDTWAQATDITGLDVKEISFVATHKQRVWFAQRDTTIGWYLPVGSVSGQATQFYFGPKFNRGGQLAGFATWSVDSGAGLDELFIAISRAGSVLVYQGSDPSTATEWSLRGAYEIGDLPAGVHFTTKHGGDVYMLSAFGVVTMNDLLSGVTLRGDDAGQTVAKISDLIQAAMNRSREDFGWSVTDIPDESLLVINSPRTAFLNTEGINTQFVFSYPTRSWGTWRQVPMSACSHWNGKVVLGDTDARILYMDVPLDEVKITPEVEGGQNGKSIEFTVLSNFSNFDAPAQYKRVKHIRPDFNASQLPPVALDAVYDYSLSFSANPNISAAQSLLPYFWDVDAWDNAFWSQAERKGYNVLYGDFGTGRSIAVAMKGYGYAPMVFLGWDIIYDVGGVL